MQERRSTVRINCALRAQYCPAKEPNPRDGCLHDISESGLGVLAREPHQEGERLTFSLNPTDEAGPLTATGLVRWSEPAADKKHWYRVGASWLPMEETARHRLITFVRANQAQDRGLWFGLISRPTVRWLVFCLFAAIAICGVLSSIWAISRERQNHQLQVAIQQRNAIINQLEQDEGQLQQELLATKTRLTQTAMQISQLSQQAQQFAADVQRMGVQIEGIQESSAQIREERSQLLQRVLLLEQERQRLMQNLSTIPGLRKAIHEAIDSRRRVRYIQRRVTPQSYLDYPASKVAVGNRGYLVRDGRPTVGSATMWIQVHEPEQQILK